MKRFIPLVFVALVSATGAAIAQQGKPIGFPDAPGSVGVAWAAKPWTPPIRIAQERTRKV